MLLLLREELILTPENLAYTFDTEEDVGATGAPRPPRKRFA